MTKSESLQFMQRISYYSELPKEYTAETREVMSIEDLRIVLERWKPFAYDAWRKAQELSWEDWRRGLKLIKIESIEAAEEANALIGDIVFPELIFKVEILASEYKVPFGVAFNRLSDVGRIVWSNDHFEILPEETSHR